MTEKRELRFSEKTVLGLSISTLCVLICTVAGASWIVGGKYEHWDNWASSVMQFIRDQRGVNEDIQGSLRAIQHQIDLRKVQAD